MPITLLKQTASITTLLPSNPPSTILSDVPPKTSDLEVLLEGAGGSDTGVWECTPGRFERQIAKAELMHILAGACTFTPTEGEVVAFGAGDTVFFPANTFGVWDVTETIRKVYVIFSGN
jgi:uncharacterized cupin superfamily protein